MSIEIAFRRIVHSAERQFALDVAFSSQHKRIVVYGPSGAGKSLTLRAIAGLLTPEAGRITVNTRVLFDSAARINLSPQVRKVGYVFQDYALFPHLTVAQNVAFGIGKSVFNPRRSAIPESARQWLAAFELDGVANSYPAQISGGQKQRTALARALAANPDILLLDEPFSALDPPLRARMRVELAALQARLDLQLLIITHDPADIEAFGDHLLQMRDGQLVTAADSPPAHD